MDITRLGTQKSNWLYYWHKEVEEHSYNSKEMAKGVLWNKTQTGHMLVPNQAKVEEGQSVSKYVEHTPTIFKKKNHFEVLNFIDRETE